MPLPGRAKLPPTFSFAQAMELGVTRRELRALLDGGNVERRARGIYVRTDVPGDEPDLVAITLLAPRATLCLTSALARHALIDDIPPTIDIALPRGTRPPATRLPVTWHRFAASTFDMGREDITIDGCQVGIYSPMRCLVDAFRLRHREGHQQAIAALRNWLRRRGSRPAALVDMAHVIDPRAEAVIRKTLEILL